LNIGALASIIKNSNFKVVNYRKLYKILIYSTLRRNKMIINAIAVNRKVAERVETLKGLDCVHFEKVSEYERMPDLVPLDNQLHFFDDGIEAIVGSDSVPNSDNERYKCTLVDENRKKLIEYSFEGVNYQPLRD